MFPYLSVVSIENYFFLLVSLSWIKINMPDRIIGDEWTKT